MILIISYILFILGLILSWYLRMLQKRNTDLILQQDLMKEHYSALEYQMEQTRRMRHDIANHIYTVEHLAEHEKDRNELLAGYKKELVKTYQNLQSVRYCEDIVINSVIHNKLHRCNELEIKVICEASDFSIGNIIRIDMLGLLYNIFDNAIEACEQIEVNKRRIQITIKNEGNSLILHSENSKNPEISLKEGQKTTKKDKANHGIGNEIIKSIVKKYNGTLKTHEEAEKYCLDIVCRWE